MQRLRDPWWRLLDELFWFWPTKSGDTEGDEALTALARGEHKAASDAWLAAERERGDDLACHNLAVFSLVVALDLEVAGRSKPLDEEQSSARDRAWQGAYRRWRAVLDRESPWGYLQRRVRQIDDPRVTGESVRRLRLQLPLALLSINAQLALEAAERGWWREVSRHARLMRQSGFDEALIDEALSRAARPDRQRISML